MSEIARLGYVCLRFFAPPTAGALFWAALVATCSRGAFPSVDLRVVRFVRAISTNKTNKFLENFGSKFWFCE